MEVIAIVLVAITADILTGLLSAFANKNFSSEKMRQGIYHKTTYIIIMALAFGLEYASGYLAIGTQYAQAFTIGVCSLIVLTELGSILENLVKINPELANNKILDMFKNK